MTYNEIISKVAEDLNLSKKLVDRTYKSYWKIIKEHIKSLPLREELTDEEFLKLQPNVNIPSIGKLYVTLDRYRRVKKHFYKKQEFINNKKDNNVKDKQD